ncbi:MAG TPA: pirin family protein [Anaeromyxobacteraceae bacterium]|nr:pirin family protein [Anaeromyxobacteraceae bacterium]
MITVRRSEERGHFDHGWLDTRHTFSFADYRDPEHMGFRSLRVLNEDRVLPGQGFGVHGHRDMEILSVVVAGALAHRDSLGTGSTIRPGELQRMTAGTGIRHSEFNASKEEPVHFLQIWILPEREGLEPSYEQRPFGAEEKRGKFRLVASPDGAEGSLTIHQDARVYASLLEPGAEVRHALGPGRHAWLQVVSGAVQLNSRSLRAGDGAAISGEAAVVVRAAESSDLLLLDLA